jgi:hypothetical protein
MPHRRTSEAGEPAMLAHRSNASTCQLERPKPNRTFGVSERTLAISSAFYRLRATPRPLRRDAASTNASTSTRVTNPWATTRRAPSRAPYESPRQGRPEIPETDICNPLVKDEHLSLRLAARIGTPNRANIALHGALLTDASPRRPRPAVRGDSVRLGSAVTFRHPGQAETHLGSRRHRLPHREARNPECRQERPRSTKPRGAGAPAGDGPATSPDAVHHGPTNRQKQLPGPRLARSRQPRERVSRNRTSAVVDSMCNQNEAQAHAANGRTSPLDELLSAHRSCRTAREQPGGQVVQHLGFAEGEHPRMLGHTSRFGPSQQCAR